MSFGKRIYQGQPFLDRRRSPRRKCNIEGEILSPDRPPRPCRVVDISDTGARLELGSGFGIADVFELSAFGKVYSAQQCPASSLRDWLKPASLTGLVL